MRKQNLRGKDINKSFGFTLIELLVTITIIGILAAITTVAYSGITQKATIAGVETELVNASRQIKLYYAEYGYYPTTLDTNGCPSAPTADTKYCVQFKSGDVYTYTSVSPNTFHLTDTRGVVSYSINSNSAPTIATTAPGSTTGSACPTGFIPVPGSGTYGTNDFCVMKYEAKADDNGDGTGDTNQTTGSNTWPADTHPISNTRKLVSTAAGYPVANISQTDAITAASSYTNGCSTGCHLITEAEWMTIAQNVLSVASNWTDAGGTTHVVGTGYIYSGHNDNVPANAIEADSNDANGYTNTGNSSPSNQRRTLTLTNGEVIWDMAGNAWEWTQGTIAGGQQPGLLGDTGYSWRQWNDVSLIQNGFPGNSMPGSIGLTGITWDSSSGVGQLYTNYGETETHVFFRGGRWGTGSSAGVLTLDLHYSSSVTSPTFVLRVAL